MRVLGRHNSGRTNAFIASELSWYSKNIASKNNIALKSFLFMPIIIYKNIPPDKDRTNSRLYDNVCGRRDSGRVPRPPRVRIPHNIEKRSDISIRALERETGFGSCPAPFAGPNHPQHRKTLGHLCPSIGAGDGIRTRDICLGKAALYH